MLLTQEGLEDEDVIRQCGHVIAKLLHADDELATVTLVFEQVTLIADAYLIEKPRDVLALCWRGEIACWAGDQRLIEEYTRRVWERIEGLSPAEIVKVTTFFALTTNLARAWQDWGWERLNFPSLHLGMVELPSGKYKRPLALAIVRRTIQTGRWDTSLLCSILELRDFIYLLDAEDLPPECWVWMAENIGRFLEGDVYYYLYWINAFRAMGSDIDPRMSHNILVSVLVGLLFNKIQDWETPSLKEILDALTNRFMSDSTGHKKKATVEVIRLVYSENPLDHLTAADRLAIRKWLATNSFEQSAVEVATPALSVPLTWQDYPLLLKPFEVELKTRISEGLWAKCLPVAREKFKEGELRYTVAKEFVGDGGDYKPYVMHYSNGLLEHIQASIKGPLALEPGLKTEFRSIFGQTDHPDHPEWSELINFAKNFEQVAGKPYGKRLMKQGVQLRHLGELILPFVEVRDYRNKAAHTRKKIDREGAALFHDLLWNKRLLEKVIRYFPIAPRL